MRGWDRRGVRAQGDDRGSQERDSEGSCMGVEIKGVVRINGSNGKTMADSSARLPPMAVMSEPDRSAIFARWMVWKSSEASAHVWGSSGSRRLRTKS
jgi:hypothetical protein